MKKILKRLFGGKTTLRGEVVRRGTSYAHIFFTNAGINRFEEFMLEDEEQLFKVGDKVLITIRKDNSRR